MVKFSRELEAQMIPEWKDAFVDYRQLKKHVKKIKLALLRSSLPSSSSPDGNPDGVAGCCDSGYGLFLLDSARAFAARFYACRDDHHLPADEENLFEMVLVQSREDEVKEFLEKSEQELKKVNAFYANKEKEFCERSEILRKQLRILIDLKQLLHEHRCSRHQCSVPPSSGGGSVTSLLSDASSVSVGNPESPAAGAEERDSLTEEVISTLERNGVSFVGLGKAKAKKSAKPRAATSLRIDIPATTPARAISMIWEDLVNSSRKEDSGGGDYLNRKKLQRAEKMIREAFVQLYRGLALLGTYSSLNMEAFRKILKKFEKVSNHLQESAAFSSKVKRSHFISSDKVMKLVDEVESIFTKHFAGSDRKKAMKFLRPQQPKESHTITFFAGLFTGSFVTLFTVYAILAHFCGIFSSTDGEAGYMQTVYPVFSMFALLSLHIFLYGCNIFAWRGTRINHNFIFEFSPNTALKRRDAFLISASLMTAVVSALVVHLLLRSAGVSQKHVDAIPGALLLVFTGLLFCPFNVFYRSTRYCFIRVMRNIALSPFYKVLMVDFFMADQLTSQIPLLRHMELTACYFMAAAFKVHPYETCTRAQQYKLLVYVISFLPYYWRAMQCVRRYIEEGHDVNHLANAGKYISAMVAAAARLKYAVEATPLWFAIVIVTSTGATFYQLFWDFVKDWGLLDLSSKNLLLRDDLILKNKCVYYASMGLNSVLRLAWIGSVMPLSLGQVEHRLLDFLLASLEIVRRGHWNFYRLENEHLNNVGKFRAVKTVPLPFCELVSDD
ncbi:phosphate transporter PHO1-2-like isoform X2 [Musa acuminata AAA Group]|uniref:phosphate transporter PHO1-2-like isoform X2 n=1 Tax=Musa acuminata AAA Group TaxID=214697 RepID=UPI0031CEA5B9